MKACQVKTYRVSTNENGSKLTAVLTAITVKNCRYWRYAANKTASLQAQSERRETSTNNQPKPTIFNPLEIKKWSDPDNLQQKRAEVSEHGDKKMSIERILTNDSERPAEFLSFGNKKLIAKP